MEKSNSHLISLLFHSRTQAHVFHFKTKSYAKHKALEEYYTAIVPLLDKYTETFQGRYGLMANYQTFPLDESPRNATRYFQGLLSAIEKTIVPNKTLENILEEIYQLVDQTIYKLKYLK